MRKSFANSKSKCVDFILLYKISFLGGSDAKESSCNAGDLGSIPGWERSPGERNGNPLQDSCLENPMDKEPDGLTVHGSQRVGHDLATKRTYKINLHLHLKEHEKSLMFLNQTQTSLCGSSMLMQGRNRHNLVKQLSFIKKTNKPATPPAFGSCLC